MWAGRRKWASAECKLDHEAIREYMDPRDRGGYEFDAERKQAAAWREMPWLPELWQDVGLPPFFEEGMTRGFEWQSQATLKFRSTTGQVARHSWNV
jgi:hypothetical protein